MRKKEICEWCGNFSASNYTVPVIGGGQIKLKLCGDCSKDEAKWNEFKAGESLLRKFFENILAGKKSYDENGKELTPKGILNLMS